MLERINNKAARIIISTIYVYYFFQLKAVNRNNEIYIYR